MIAYILVSISLAVCTWIWGSYEIIRFDHNDSGDRLFSVADMIKKRRVCTLILFILLGVVCAYLFRKYEYTLSKMIRYEFLIYSVLIVAYIDRLWKTIPNRILIVMGVIRIVILLAEILLYRDNWIDILSFTFGGLIIGFTLFIIIYYISRKGIGMGDVKLLSIEGAYVGAAVLYAVVIVTLLCTVLYSVIQLVRKKINMKDQIPFGPFIASGTLTVLLLGL